MITKSIKNRIMEHFFLYPTERLRVREIERKAKVPLPSAIKYAKELEKEGILKSVEISNVRLYMADRSSKKFLQEKKLHNLRSIYSSGMVEKIIQECSNPAISLFGSYSRGEDIETSDIDLYVQTKEKIDAEIFEKTLKRKIQLFCYSDLSKIDNKELANNIINGIVLNGFLEVIK